MSQSPPRHTSESIAKDLAEEIRSGRWAPGEQLPTQTELAKHYNVARMTVTTAVKRLKEMGLLTSRRGAGAFVTMPSSAPAITTALEDSLRAGTLGMSTFTGTPRLLHVALRKPLASVLAGTQRPRSIRMKFLIHRNATDDSTLDHLRDTLAGIRDEGIEDAHLETRTLASDSAPFDFVIVEDSGLFFPMPEAQGLDDPSSNLSSWGHFRLPSSDPNVSETVFKLQQWFDLAWSNADR